MNITQYRNALRVNKHRLDDELEIQAQFLEDIGRQMALAEARVNAAKDSVDRVEARILVDLRTRAADKMPAQEISARVTTAPERIKEVQALAQAQHDLAEWKALYEAWRGRGYALKTLGDLYAQQYFSVTSVGGTRVSVPPPTPRALQHQRALDEDDTPPVIVARRRA